MVRTRQLPGIAFRAEIPFVADLPRMDVAAFVGFARCGPLHTPVPVESYPDFEDIFGGTYRLAWDDEMGMWQSACLAPAVNAFFANGGRRCWIVRVAGEQATTNRFPVAGLLQSTAGSLQGVAAAARSPGSWSDSLRVAAGLQVDPLTYEGGAIVPGTSFALLLSLRRGQPVTPGDLVQLDGTDDRHRAYIVVDAAGLEPGERTLVVTADPSRTFWFRRLGIEMGDTLAGTVHTVAPAGEATATASLDVAALALQTSLPVVEGDWLRLDTDGGERVWLLAGTVEADTIRIATAWLEGADAAEVTPARLLRVQFALQVRQQPDRWRNLSDLGCAAPHPRFAGYLPADASLYDPHFGRPDFPEGNPAGGLWQEVRHPRFDLSLDLEDGAVILPLGLEGATVWRGALVAAEPPLLRDGLVPETDDAYTLTGSDWASFLPDVFLDPYLAYSGQRSLLAEANDRLYLQGEPLLGIHALLPVEEVSLVALPDAAHRGWYLTERESETAPPPPLEEEVTDPCLPEGPFAPKVTGSGDSEEGEDTPVQEISLAPLPETTQWQLLAPVAYEADGLLRVQEALAEVAAARGDLLALLGLPNHYRTPEVLQYRRDLVLGLRAAGDTTPSYAALYHPWLVTRAASGELLATHPAGAVSGLMAARSRDRGAWVAPANEALRETLALRPAGNDEQEASFYSAGINPIRQEARGFVVWGAFTQSEEPLLEDVNVRRLLILLRRLALREAQKYVFAPHSPAFRRRVRQLFEQQLARLFARGAFAGREPVEAYRVVIDETINTPASIEQGRLIVELRVAPSQPLTFITVRLVQLESGLLTVEEVTHNGS